MPSCWLLGLFLFGSLLYGEAHDQLPQLKCGQGNPKGLEPSKKITDDLARPGEFPWTVAVMHNLDFLGGGSLISPGIVLTAAHLLRNKTAQDILVSAGEGDFENPMEHFPIEQRNVSKIVRHESFKWLTGANNLALLFLVEPFDLTPHINTICLASEQRSFEVGRCLVTGWGKVEFKDENYSTALKKIDLPIVPSARCQELLRRTILGRSFMMDPGFICAGGEEAKDSCVGDGGGPLFCPIQENPERFEQVGIVNWGVDCRRGNVPAVYTSVIKFAGWIRQQVDLNK